MNYINYYGLGIMLLLMVPNIIFSKKNVFVNLFKCQILFICENITRYITFILMIVNLPWIVKNLILHQSNNTNETNLSLYIITNAIFLLIYIVTWIILHNKTNMLKALVLSICPSIIFIFSSIINKDIFLFVSSIIFSASHIIISVINTYRELKYLSKPQENEESDLSIWTDSHISSQMLSCHLDGTNDLSSRKTETIIKTITFISTLLKPNAKILDLGCGPGLYTKRFSDLGYQVTGIDFSLRSINYAHEVDNKTTYLCLDYLNIDYSQEFDAITLIYCDYPALIKEKRLILLKKISKSLKDDGIFILDVFSTAFENKVTTSYDKQNSGFWSDKPYEELQKTFKYENNTYVSKEVIITKKDIKTYLIWDKLYTIESFSEEIKDSGLTIAGIYGSLQGDKYQADSKIIAFVLKKC